MTAQEILTARYGDPREPAFQPKFLVSWNIVNDFAWFPKKKIFIHKDFRTRLLDAFSALELDRLHTEIKTFDGCFNIRLVRGSKSVLSIHSWACAMDLNAAENPLGGAGKWSTGFINTMESCGIFCGQNFHGRKDPMHFALVNG